MGIHTRRIIWIFSHIRPARSHFELPSKPQIFGHPKSECLAWFSCCKQLNFSPRSSLFHCLSIFLLVCVQKKRCDEWNRFVVKAAQRKFWNLSTKVTGRNRVLFCHAAKIFGICQLTQLKLTTFAAFDIFQQKQPQLTVIILFCRTAKIWKLPTKVTELKCVLSAAHRKILHC
jgi:hypothetical protein